jgi:hypothetical protein
LLSGQLCNADTFAVSQNDSGGIFPGDRPEQRAQTLCCDGVFGIPPDGTVMAHQAVDTRLCGTSISCRSVGGPQTAESDGGDEYILQYSIYTLLEVRIDKMT